MKATILKPIRMKKKSEYSDFEVFCMIAFPWMLILTFVFAIWKLNL